MPKIAAGVVRFQKEVYPEKRELFARLAEGQKPDALFITCSDSRIDPNLVTQTEPGELFICRNAGNIVPPHATHTGGMTASIEYAVAVLGVQDIVVCGHIGCGAIEGAMRPERIVDLPHVSEPIPCRLLTTPRGRTMRSVRRGTPPARRRQGGDRPQPFGRV